MAQRSVDGNHSSNQFGNRLTSLLLQGKHTEYEGQAVSMAQQARHSQYNPFHRLATLRDLTSLSNGGNLEVQAQSVPRRQAGPPTKSQQPARQVLRTHLNPTRTIWMMIQAAQC